MTKLPHPHPLLSALMLSVGLAACGGSDGPPAPPPVVSNEVPASAYASNTAYSQYAGSLAVNETSEPLDVDKVVAPTTETAEPIDLS